MILWAFGIVFLVFVAIFCTWLFKGSAKNRENLGRLSRGVRVRNGAVAVLASFASALGAIEVATKVKDWQNPSFGLLLVIMVFMIGFVCLQVVGMVSFLSLAYNSETDDPTKRP